MLANLAPYLPYVLPLVYIVLNEVIAHNPNITSNSLLQAIVSGVMNALKAAVNANPQKPLP